MAYVEIVSFLQKKSSCKGAFLGVREIRNLSQPAQARMVKNDLNQPIRQVQLRFVKKPQVRTTFVEFGLF
jgi:hypothetical protein